MFAIASLLVSPLMLEFHRDQTGDPDHRKELTNESFDHR
jgi:hypothetical protein